MTDQAPGPYRILVVEDEPLVALNTEQILLEFDFEVAAVVGTIDEALRRVTEGGFHAAILDVNLQGQRATPVAAALAAGAIPFIVTTGYANEQLPEGLQDAPFIQKPFRASHLIEAVNRLLSSR